jgi:hypothetical protein
VGYDLYRLEMMLEEMVVEPPPPPNPCDTLRIDVVADQTIEPSNAGPLIFGSHGNMSSTANGWTITIPYVSGELNSVEFGSVAYTNPLYTVITISATVLASDSEETAISIGSTVLVSGQTNYWLFSVTTPETCGDGPNISAGF